MDLRVNTEPAVGRRTLLRQEGWRIAGRALGEAAASLQGITDAAGGSGYRMKYIPKFVDSVLRSSFRAVVEVGGYVAGAEDTVEIGHTMEPDGNLRLWAKLKTDEPVFRFQMGANPGRKGS